MVPPASGQDAAAPAVCPTNLVTDSPPDTDAFGAHGRIAQAIAQSAGKSTVVEIRRRQLEADPRSPSGCSTRGRTKAIRCGAYSSSGSPRR
jgi:hypothetical protein